MNNYVEKLEKMSQKHTQTLKTMSDFDLDLFQKDKSLCSTVKIHTFMLAIFICFSEV